MSNWDGEKYVEDDPRGKPPAPEDVQDAIRTLLRWAGDDPTREGLLDTPKRVARVNESEKRSETVRWTKSAGNLKPSKYVEIKSSIISSLKQVESAVERQSIFNSVAADLGIAIPQASEPQLKVATDASAPLPVTAPEIYRERSNPAETAEQFLRRAYEPWLAAGSLFQFHIGKLDPTLLQGLKNQFKGRAEELRAILPTKKDAVSQRLAALVGKEVDDPAQRRLLAQAERNMSYAIAKLKR